MWSSNFDYHRIWWHHIFLRQRTVVNADHRGGWTQIFDCKAPEQRLLDRSKTTIFTHPTCIWRPCWGWSSRNFVEIFCITKQVPGLSCGVVFEIICLGVLVQLRLVTDGRTDGRTRDDSKYSASIASRQQKSPRVLLFPYTPTDLRGKGRRTPLMLAVRRHWARVAR